MIQKEYFGEGKNIEFKREIPSNHERFLKDIIAFSNSTGGKVILGIEEETNIVYGIGDASPFKISDSISNMISDACTPQIEPDISIHTIEDKTLLVIDIAAGKFRPYYIASRGKESSSYIRINGTSRPADARKLQELELEGQNISYDSLQQIGEEYDEKKALDLCHKMTQIAISSCKTEEERNAIKEMTLEKLHDFGILCRVGKDFYPTHAFDFLTENRDWFARVQCAVFKGTVRDIFIDKKEFDGPIYEQIEAAHQFVLRHINLGIEIEGIYRSESYELPPSAIREMIANAVVHRSYLQKTCIQVCVFDDRVEVISPGMLYDGVDLETVKRGKSICRNKAIAAAFHYMQIVEAWGTGIPRIISRCKEYGLSEPVFEEYGDGFIAVLFRKTGNDLKKIGNDTEKIGNDTEKIGNDTKKEGIAFKKYIPLFIEAEVTEKNRGNIEQVFTKCGLGVSFGQANVMEWLQCSKAKAGILMKEMRRSKVIRKVVGLGPGKYEFIEL